MSKKDKGIRTSPEHGLNLSTQLCFRREEPMGDYNPCDKCESQCDQRVTVLEVTKTCPSEGAPPFQDNLCVTGSYVVFDEDKKGDVFLALEEDFEEILHRGKETQDE